jgi:hypothetical protein
MRDDRRNNTVDLAIQHKHRRGMIPFKIAPTEASLVGVSREGHRPVT